MIKKITPETGYIVWQEVFDKGHKIKNDAIIQVWRPFHQEELREVTNRNHQALLSSCWYLDDIKTGPDWHDYYRCDPHDFLG
jgi:hexosaminidase